MEGLKKNLNLLIHKHSLTEKTTFVDQVEIDKIPTIVDKASALFLSFKKRKDIFNDCTCKTSNLYGFRKTNYWCIKW